MIDLNYQPKKDKKKEEDTPVGILIIGLFPFAILFYIVLATSFIHGIY